MHSDGVTSSEGAHQGGEALAGRHKREGRRVRFAPGILRTADGHPNSEGETAKPKRSLGLNRFIQALTKRSVLQLQDFLGMADYGPSIMKLRRRCGLDSAAKRPRPYATATPKKRVPIFATTCPSSSGSLSEGDGAHPRLAGNRSVETSKGQRGRSRKQQDGVGGPKRGVAKKGGQQKGVQTWKGKEEGVKGGGGGKRTKGKKGWEVGGGVVMEGAEYPGVTERERTGLRRASRLQAPSSADIARRLSKTTGSQACAMATDNLQRIGTPARRSTRASAATAAAAAAGDAAFAVGTAGVEAAGDADMVDMSGAGAGVGRVGRVPGVGSGKATTRALRTAEDRTGHGNGHQRQSIVNESMQQPRTVTAENAKRDGAVGRAKGGGAEVREAEGRGVVRKHVCRGVCSVRGKATAVEAAGANIHTRGANVGAKEATAAAAAAAAAAAVEDAAVHAEPVGRLTRCQFRQQLQQQANKAAAKGAPLDHTAGGGQHQQQRQQQRQQQQQQQEQEQVEEQGDGMQRTSTRGLRQQAEEELRVQEPGPWRLRLPLRGRRRLEVGGAAATVLRTRKGGEVKRGMPGDAAQPVLEDNGQGLHHIRKDQTWQGAPHTLKRTRRQKTGAMLHADRGGREELMDVDGEEGRQGGRLAGVDDPMLEEENATAASGDGGDEGWSVRKRRRVTKSARKEGKGGDKKAEGGGEKMGDKVRDRGGEKMKVVRGLKSAENGKGKRGEGKKGASEGEHESAPKNAVRRSGRGRGREKQQGQQQHVESDGHNEEVWQQGLAGQRQQQQHMQQVQLQQHGQQQQQQQQQQQDEGCSQPPGEAPGSDSEPTSADSVLPRPPSPPSVCARRRGARRAAAPRPSLPVAAGRQQKGVARGGQRGGDPDIEKARPAVADGVAHPSTSQSSGAHRAGAFGLVVHQAGPAATPMAYLPAPGSTPVAAAPVAAATLTAAAAAAATDSTAAGAEKAAVSGEREVGGLRGAGHTRAYARSPLGRISGNLPMGPAYPSFAPPHHPPRLSGPSAMLPPRFAASKAANNSGGGGGGWSVGKIMAGSGPGMSSVHSMVGSTHGVKTGGDVAGGNGGGSGGGRQVAPSPTAQVPHHAAAGSRRPPVVPGSRGDLMQRSLHGRQGTMLIEDEGDVLPPPGAVAVHVSTPGTTAMPGHGSGPSANKDSSAAAAALMPPPRRSGNPGGVGSRGGAHAIRSSGGPAWGPGSRKGDSGRGVGGGSGRNGGEGGGEGGGGDGGVIGEAGIGEGGMEGSTAQVPEVCMSSTGGMGKQQAQGVTSTPRCLRLLNA